MMIKRILTICAAIAAVLAAGAAGTSLALAQQGYPAYSTVPEPYPQGDYRRGSGKPDFDGLDDEDGPNAQSSTALPPPGPVLSPDDPRYGRPMNAPPVYSDRAMPTGPVRSPDDPRYGRPMNAPLVMAAPPDRRSRPIRTAVCVRRRLSGRRVASPERCSRRLSDPMADLWCCPRCRPMNSPRSGPRNSRRTCAGRKSLSRPRSLRER
jgi:hypothetical protein